MSAQHTVLGYPIILGGSKIKKLSYRKKTVIAEQIMKLLRLHVKEGHMIQQSIIGLIRHMDAGLAVVALSYNDTVLGFAKLYAHRSRTNEGSPLGYEFSSWVVHPTVTHNGIGSKILMESLRTFHRLNNPQAGFFAVCVAKNSVPLQKLLTVGGVTMKRPSYVPYLLEAQTGIFQEEVIIDLKGIQPK